MRVARVVPHSFRNLADAAIDLGPGLTVLHGPNGAGKTNVLEALFFALTGRSCRTRREREMIAFGGELARVEALLEPDDGEHADPIAMLASISSGEARRRLVDGSPAQPSDDHRRPAISIFMPDRLALVTDSMRAVDLPDGEYWFGPEGRGERVRKMDGVGVTLDGLALASGATGMDHTVRTMHRSAGVPLPETIRMASLTPARILGIDSDVGSIEVGKRADFVMMDADLNVRQVWIGGEKIV